MYLFVAHLTDVKGYIITFFPLFDGIQICPGDSPRMALTAIVYGKVHSKHILMSRHVLKLE